MSNRPKTPTTEMKTAAAAEIVGSLINDGHLEEDQRDESISDIVRYAGTNDDGYQIAKRLDSSAWWDCTFDMLETLDAYSRAVSDELAKAEKVWFEENKPEPPFATGEKVAFGRRNETGVIDGIYKYGPAKFTIAVDGDESAHTESQSRRIVNFEDCRALALTRIAS